MLQALSFLVLQTKEMILFHYHRMNVKGDLLKQFLKMKQNHRNYQLITQMMLQSKTTFNIPINEYHN